MKKHLYGFIFFGVLFFGLTSTANAALLQATWHGSISSVGPNLGLWDTHTSLNSSDIFAGQQVTGTLTIDTFLSGPDNQASSDAYEADPDDGQPVGPPPYFLTLGLSLNGNTYTPVFETRPPGAIDFGDADQALLWNSSGDFAVDSDWDTRFSGIFHNRELNFTGTGVSGFNDALPTENTDFSGFSGVGSAWVEDFSQAPGANTSSFLFAVDSMSNFSVVPIPAALPLLGSALGVTGIAAVRRRKRR